MNKRILSLTIPNIISNISVPLLGMVDLAIVGQLGNTSYIGAIAIGTAIFNLVYWNFGFLRMGTSGFAAQAYGARDLREAVNVLLRSIFVALCIAVMIISFQWFLGHAAIRIMNTHGQMESLALDYFFVRVWAAPATLSLYAFKGWFIGMQNTRYPMWFTIVINIVNIIFSYIFVFWFDMGVKGVALGTVIAQYSGVLMALTMFKKGYGKLFKYISISSAADMKSIKLFFHVNSDIFLRTICLCAVFTFFTSASSAMGETTLAANTILMQMFIFFSYVMDGFAYSAEALTGRFVGSGNRIMLKSSIKHIIGWGIGISVLFTLIYLSALTPIMKIFTADEGVIAQAEKFHLWIAAVPLAGFLAFLYDGILVGATQTKIMRNTMYIATAIFFGIFYSMTPIIEDSALWLAFITYLLLRGLLEMWFSYKIIFK